MVYQYGITDLELKNIFNPSNQFNVTIVKSLDTSQPDVNIKYPLVQYAVKNMDTKNAKTKIKLNVQTAKRVTRAALGL
jgi:hypothetical protein